MTNLRVISKKHDEEQLNLIIKKYNLSSVTAQVVMNRGLKDLDDVEEYLNPKLENLENTDVYKDLDKGCKRLIEAVEKNEKIIVYGDYDVDGTTSASQIVLYLKELNAEIDYYIPHRENEGYGISDLFIQEINKKNVDLIITVDCGISEIERIDELNELGYDTIIIDHHTVGEIIPNAYAVVNPKQKDCKSVNKDLCASGLVFKFLKHVNRYFHIENIEDKLIELACLGTVADIVKLLGDNRIITFYGLKALNNSKLVGIEELIYACCGNDEIDSKSIGFRIAPKINAAGRMKSANIAVDLMICDDKKKAKKLAEQLLELNDLRKHTENLILEEAINQIEENKLYDQNIIVVSGNEWHEGVLGIVSSVITNKYRKPSLVISNKNNVSKGSARSIDYLDIYDALSSQKKYLMKFGGHKLAGGFSLRTENLEIFADNLNRYVMEKIEDTDIVEEIVIDAEIEIKNVNRELLNDLKKLEPFGHGNADPIFYITKYDFVNLKLVGNTKDHVSCFLAYEEKSVKAIAFNFADKLNDMFLKPKGIVANVTENIFRNTSNLQININKIDCSDYQFCEYSNDSVKALDSSIIKAKSKILKVNIFDLVYKLNRIYNMKITPTEVINILNNEKKYQYVLKKDTLYIKK